MSRKKSVLIVFILYLILAATVITYWFGLSGPLLLDDFNNLQTLGDQGGVSSWEGAKKFIFGNGSGPLGRSVSMATFLLNDSNWPVYSVASFKLTNLAFHLCVGLAILLVIRRLFVQEFKFERRSAELLSLLVFAFWLMHPIHISTVLYVIQRMTILSAFFSLLAFLFYLQFRVSFINRSIPSTFCNAFLFGVFFLLAVFSKENALLLIPFIYICEFFIFKSLLPTNIKKKAVLLAYTLLLTSPIWLYFTYDFWGLGYAERSFDLHERLTLQVAIIGDYVGKIILPTVGRMNLFNERFSPSAISMYNSSFLIGLLSCICFLVVFGISVLKKNRLVIFGLMWFICFHLLESTIIPLELYFEHRNYLPSVGLIIGFIGITYSALNRNFSKGLVYFFYVCMFVYLCFTTLILSKTWGSADTLYIKLSGDEPSSVRAKVTYAAYLEARELPEFALAEIEEAIELSPELLSLRLNEVRLICKYTLKETISDEIKEIEQAYLFDSGVIFQLEQLIKIKNTHCSELEGDDSFIDFTFLKAEKSENFNNSSRFGSQFYNLLTDFYIGKRMFNPAIESLDKAIGFAPTIDLYVRKIVLLSSAGLYEDALLVVPEAFKANKLRGYYIPSRQAEIEFLQMSLQNQIKKEKMN
jgi:tetratricopeptide (TPR) repeat protein